VVAIAVLILHPTPAGRAGEIATGTVDDGTGAVIEAWTGPQVAWKMGRGYKGAFGGDKINDPWYWGAFCLVFLVGLADLRRPLSVRNLDLLMLLSPTASLWYFNHGNVFTAVPLSGGSAVHVLAVSALNLSRLADGTSPDGPPPRRSRATSCDRPSTRRLRR